MNNATKNAGPGYAIYANGNTTFMANHNSYFTSGATFGYWNGGAVETTFANWQAASGQDANSINVDPVFMSNTDLHTFLVLLNETGDPTTGIQMILMARRGIAMPDIGADEFDPLPSNDAGIFMFGGPHIPFAAGITAVDLVVKNFGGNVLTSVIVNGRSMVLNRLHLTGRALLHLHMRYLPVGSYVFDELTQYIIDAWTEMPNGVQDANPDNDLFPPGCFMHPSPAHTQ